ncbi:OB-fold domain-containing protein [Pseudofrankia sp. BMG5.37]|uniref:Zn-ribbon domain-containing OB-fold protein n=1 Tax=Pseudofrankia sp. BMG5.37 TaxID=3050035 RepID=UPI0028950419|nr:OB-fold domain-containing protein [Pseudofrankia sp. BMG5.37]MDT3444395.1 OB-fold domain-containing protein [Pseudofrankia sp. BMG5.37]
MTRRPLPVTDDLDTGGFFEAAARGELVVRRCDGCDAVLHMPRAYCATCGSWEGRWQPVAATGTVYSWTVVEHQVHPAFPVPYTVVLVKLDDVPGTRLVGHLPGRPALRPGQAMAADFEDVDGTVLPRWRTADVSPAPAP